jgi:flagellar biosynthesis protein
VKKTRRGLEGRAPAARRTAVALKYDEASAHAPQVVASGKGAKADRIVQIARDHNVPVHQDRDLAETLSLLDTGQFIPEELYEVVAEVMVFVYHIDRRRR